MANTVTVSFKVPPEDAVAIQCIAIAKRVTVSYLCRTVVCRALRTESYWQVMLAERARSQGETEDPDGLLPGSDPDVPLDLLH
jgi:hypothetical protein